MSRDFVRKEVTREKTYTGKITGIHEMVARIKIMLQTG
jgi:hypothetical protein